MTTSRFGVVGIDVGGTKTHIAFLDEDGLREDLVLPSDRWRTGSLFSDVGNLERLAGIVTGRGIVDAGTRVVAGMNGVDSPAQAGAAERALTGALNAASVTVISDAELLGHAVGTEQSMQMIVGTGSVVLGRDRDGAPIRALGYGWRFNDYGSAPALVREAVRELHRDADDGGEASDPLAGLLQSANDVRDLTELTLALSDRAGLTEWGRHAPLIFQAAEAGSPIATRVIDDAARHLADAALAVRRRGAVGDVIVAAGGVIVNQQRMQDAVRAALAHSSPHLLLTVLGGPPVDGALAVARTLVSDVRTT